MNDLELCSAVGGYASWSIPIGLIVIMNLVFSFDSILSAMALTKSLAIMSAAIIASGILMIVDVVQGRYQKKLLARQKKLQAARGTA